MLSFLPSILALGLAALAAWSLTRGRGSPPESAAARHAASVALALSLLIQTIHFVEEAATGFDVRLGPLFGLPEMPRTAFLVFNLIWIGIWVASIPGLREARPLAFFAAWFLAIAGMINGIAHPLLALAAEGYFPGLVSSPFIGLASVWLWVRLRRATAPRANPV